MTTTRDELRKLAMGASHVGATVHLNPQAVLALLDQLDTAEHAARLAHDRAYKADGAWEDEKRRAGQAEARIRDLEATARVLVKETLDAEEARDKHRHGETEAVARIKAVQDVLDRHKAEGLNPYALDTDIRRALEG